VKVDVSDPKRMNWRRGSGGGGEEEEGGGE